MSAARFNARLVSWHDAETELRSVRGTVFIHEQGIPEELEWDTDDACAIHALITGPDHQPIATGRLLLLKNGEARIGRMAVLPAWRHQGVGTIVLHCLLDAARRHGVRRVVLHAQTTAVPFYERFHFVCAGDEYLEAGIPHQRMTLSASG